MIIPPSFLFQIQLEIPRIDGLPRKSGRPLQLPPEAAVFVPSRLNERSEVFDLRAAWNPEGLGIELTVRGKTQEPAGRAHDLKSSDHVLIFVDTRHTANVHRATEYCSSILVLPSDENAEDRPTVQFLEIAQQRGTPREQEGRRCIVACELQSDGYRMELWIPAAQLPGFVDAPDIGHIGFCLMVEDTELGQLPLSIGDDFPVVFDPSTWIQLDLKS